MIILSGACEPEHRYELYQLMLATDCVIKAVSHVMHNIYVYFKYI